MKHKIRHRFIGAVAAKMFFRQANEVIDWLRDRKYVAEIEEANRLSADRAAKKAAEVK